MSAAARRKGRTYQTAARQWLEAHSGTIVVEPGGAGMETTDLLLFGFGISVEVKNQKAMALASWVDQARRQAPDTFVPVVLHKRAGKGDVGDHYVTMTAGDFVRLLEKIA